nr:DUF4368 domain-containing protein [Neobacillus terrae]
MLKHLPQKVELERAEIKKAKVESHTTSKISAIIEQLKEYSTFNTLTSEMLLRFVDKIEITENKDIKIYYNFAQVEGGYSPQSFFKTICKKHTTHVDCVTNV